MRRYSYILGFFLLDMGQVHTHSYFSLMWSFAIVLLFALLSLAFYHGLFTGFAELSLKNDPLVAGELITGSVSYDLNNGPLPIDSEVILAIGGYEKTVPLKKLYDTSAFIPEVVSFSPRVKVTVALKEFVSGGGHGVVARIEDVSQGGGGENGGEMGGIMAIAPIITYETYYVRAGSAFETTIPSKRKVSLYEVRRADNNELLDSSNVILNQRGTSLVLTSRYQESVAGFASRDSFDSLPFSLEGFAFTLSKRAKSPTSLKISLSYRGDAFASLEEQMTVIPAPPTPTPTPPSDFPTPLEDSAPSASKPSCEDPVCTPFGACAIPPLERSGARILEGSSYVRSSQCLCEDGTSFVREEICVFEENSHVFVAAGVGDSNAAVPAFFPGLPAPSQGLNNPPGEGRRDSSWRTTYSFDERDFVISGSVAQALAKRERMALPLEGVLHSIGIIDIDFSLKDPRVLIEVESTPQQFYLSLGETKAFDVQGDGVSDFSATFVSLSSRTYAVLKVVPLESFAFSRIAHPGERTATLFKLPEDIPVAYVVVNEDLPALRVFFVQSSVLFSPTCSDSVLNGDEAAVDCGGSCNPCRRENLFIAPFIAWGSVLVLFFLLIFVSRRTS